MRIAEFEKAFRAATGDSTMQPILATPGASIPINAQLPEEFRAAARTLADRSLKPRGEDSMLGAAAQWT